MIYWPISAVAGSPLLHHTHVWELMCAYQQPSLSESTMHACNQIVGYIPGINTPIVIVSSVDAPYRRVYTERPSPEAFEALERGGFVAGKDTFGFVIDALH